MDDLISREKAIEALLKEFERDTPKAIRAKLTLENLPSAQPEKRTEKRTETHACDLDVIDRQAVIDTVHKIILEFFPEKNGVINDTEKTLLSVNKAICNGVRELPSAQPERKKGKWIIYVISMLDGEGCKYSECGFEGAPYWDFCPNCGADMRGGQDESD